MSRFHRGLAIGAAAVQIATAGCAFGRKPYTNDPLIEKNRAVWGDRDKARVPEDAVGAEPVIPLPPKSPLIGVQIDDD